MLKISSILENPDPQSKIISFLAIIFSVIWIPITNFKDFGLYSLLIPAISFLLKITLGQILKKMCILISFVLFVAVFMPFVKEGFVCWSRKLGYWKLEIAYEGIWTFLDIVVKLNLFLFLFISASSKTFPDFFSVY